MEYTVNDIPIYYEVHGSGRPILMIHGWSPDHRLMKGCMEPVLQSMDTSWQRIYFDLPGMGKTPGHPWVTGTDRMLEIILEFIDGVIPGQHFVLAGESYGGYLARGVIKERRELVDGLLLICPIAIQETHQKNTPTLQVLEKDEAFLDSLSEENRQYFEGINVIQNKRVWERFSQDVLPGLKIADYEFLENSLGQHVPYTVDVDRIERPYTQPTLMVMGRQDSMVGYRDHWQLIENYPRASFVILDKAGHNLQIEQDILFSALVKEWLDRIEAEISLPQSSARLVS
jgi:pimeloyl-ACP methyl ester carboxylesterase